MKKIYKTQIFKKSPSYNYAENKKYKDIKEVIEKRYNILSGIVIFVMVILFVNLFYLQVLQNEYYMAKASSLSFGLIKGPSAPRGRIYDRNHKLIVTNKPTKLIYYKKPSGVKVADEIKTAYKAAELIAVSYDQLTDTQLKNFWLKSNPVLAKAKIKASEWQKLKERKLTSADIDKLKMDRVSEADLASYTKLDKEAAYIYRLMNIGYATSEKVIKKKDITDKEYALISENLHVLNGISTRLDWDREYLYGSTFKSILGSVSSSSSGVPYELKDYYLEKGYHLNDRVGLSNIEFQYEDILAGKKDEYHVLSDGTMALYSEGKRGNDIVLTIDIELQREVEKILEANLLRAKSEANTKYFDHAFVIINDPYTGDIIAMAGKQIVKKGSEYIFYDYTPGIYTSPVVAGSLVKGASHIVGYNTGALKIGEVRDDTCIKIASTPIKCSWKYLGKLNDLTALKYSSNTYQYNTAIKVGKGNYVANKALAIDQKAFDIYRNTFNQFGLGLKTEIDLPVESLGYKGTSRQSGHLLDFSIGQYDTYTPIQLAQYMSTIANGGSRIAPHLLKEVYDSTSSDLSVLISKVEPKVLNTVNTKVEYINRVKQGFKQVLEPGGSGYYIVDPKYNAAGKTGTSESFIDSNNDGVVDKLTITNTFSGYAPYDNPKVVFTVISPNITSEDSATNYATPVNRRISYEVSKKFFEIYK